MRDGNRRSLHYAPPDFLSNLLALAILMRLSLWKGAYVDVASSAWEEIPVRSGRDDKVVGDLTPYFSEEIVTSLQKLCHLDRSEA